MQIEKKPHKWQKCPHCKARGVLTGNGRRKDPYYCTSCGGRSYDLIGGSFVDELFGVVAGIYLIYAMLTYSWPIVALHFAAAVTIYSVVFVLFWPKIRL